jgi:hypothetical protein
MLALLYLISHVIAISDNLSIYCLLDLKPNGSEEWSESVKHEFSLMILNKWFTAYFQQDAQPVLTDNYQSITLVGTREGKFFFVHSDVVERGLAVSQ